MTDEKFWQKLERMHEEIILLRIEVAKLKIKSGLWGFAAGLISTIGLFIIKG